MDDRFKCRLRKSVNDTSNDIFTSMKMIRTTTLKAFQYRDEGVIHADVCWYIIHNHNRLMSNFSRAYRAYYDVFKRYLEGVLHDRR